MLSFLTVAAVFAASMLIAMSQVSGARTQLTGWGPEMQVPSRDSDPNAQTALAGDQSAAKTTAAPVQPVVKQLTRAGTVLLWAMPAISDDAWFSWVVAARMVRIIFC